jgi:hypothetical protein
VDVPLASLYIFHCAGIVSDSYRITSGQFDQLYHITITLSALVDVLIVADTNQFCCYIAISICDESTFSQHSPQARCRLLVIGHTPGSSLLSFPSSPHQMWIMVPQDLDCALRTRLLTSLHSLFLPYV